MTRPVPRGLRGRRAAHVAAVFLLSSSLAAAVALGLRLPQPSVHDELSHLLAADTFAHGRLTNPPHPMWEHFETIHVLSQPTYMSKYPPGQGAFLALGQRLFGHPIVGVWLSFGLMCAAVCWMLQAFVPPRWALLGALLVLLRTGFSPDILCFSRFGYWAQSYWGGAVPALGGALLFGALGRLERARDAATPFVFGAGLALLALSRPYEGLLVALPATAFLVVRHAKEGRPVLVRVALAGAATLAFIAYDNFRVTGRWWLLPYVLYEKTYGVVPLFVWQSFGSDPLYRHETLRRFNVDWQLDYYRVLHGAGWWENVWKHKWLFVGTYFLGPLLGVPLLLLPWISRSRWSRRAALVIAVFLAGFAFEVWSEPHYAAPVTGLVFLLVVQGIRHLRFRLAGRRRWGRIVPAAFLLGSLALAVPPVVALARSRIRPWSDARARIQETLARSGGRHLVIVHYVKDHWILNEWVYNEADIDAAPVVWAREMNPEKDAELRAYFKDRTAWILAADELPPRLRPLPPVPSR